MALKSIAAEWEGFAAMVFRGMKPAPSETQVAETKQAFIAGAWAMVNAFEEIGMDHVSEDEAFAYVEARRAECLEFKDQLMRRYVEKN